MRNEQRKNFKTTGLNKRAEDATDLIVDLDYSRVQSISLIAGSDDQEGEIKGLIGMKLHDIMQRRNTKGA